MLVFSLWDSNGMGWLAAGNASPCTGNEQVEHIENSNSKVTR
jgi:hypothetical protein